MIRFWRLGRAPSPRPCAHAHPVLNAPSEPLECGPCVKCGATWQPTVLHCSGCLRPIPAGSRECPTERCQEQTAALVAEWIANGAFEGIDGEGQR